MIATTLSPLQRVQSRINEMGQTYEYRESTGYYVTACPVKHNHKNEDKHVSFGFREFVSTVDNADTEVHFNCFAGCTEQEILRALQMKRDDLYSKPGSTSGLASFQYDRQTNKA